MGIVLFEGGRPYVFEAVASVRFAALDAWIAWGKGGHFVLKRLVGAPSILTPTSIKRLHAVARTFKGKPYDLTFEWSDDRIYCSELVWKIYQPALGIKVGQLQRLGEFRLHDPVVRSKLQERYGNDIPINEPVISPAAMFNSKLLEVVADK